MSLWLVYAGRAHGRRDPVTRGVSARAIVGRLYAAFLALLYRQAAWAYDAVAWLVSFGRWGVWRRLALPLMDDGLTLELGFGPGHLLREAAAQGNRIVGLDASPEMVARASLRGKNRNLPVLAASLPAVVCGRGESLPFGEGVFSQIVATFPAPYILDPSTLRECHRVLSPDDGRMIIVGLWVATTVPLLNRLTVFYGRPSRERITWMAQRFAAAGYLAEFQELAEGRFGVGTVVATRTVRCPDPY